MKFAFVCSLATLFVVSHPPPQGPGRAPLSKPFPNEAPSYPRPPGSIPRSEPNRGVGRRGRGGDVARGRGKMGLQGRRSFSSSYGRPSAGMDALWHVARLQEARQRRDMDEGRLIALLTKAITAAGKAGINKMAQGLLMKALDPAEGIRPNRVLFHSAIRSVKPSNARTAIPTIFSLLDSSSVKPDNVTYSLALNALSRSGDWAIALSLLRRHGEEEEEGREGVGEGGGGRRTQEKGLGSAEDNDGNGENDNIHYTSKGVTVQPPSGGSEGQAQEDTAKRLYPGLAKVPWDAVRLALVSCEKGKEWRAAAELMQEALEAGHPHHPQMYAAVAAAASNSDKPGRALKLLDQAGHFGVRRSLCMYHAAIHACARHGWWEKASGLVRNAQKNGLRPNGVTYTAFMASLVPRGKWAIAIKTLKKMEREGTAQGDSRATAAANKAMQVCLRGKAWRRALHVFETWMPRAMVQWDIQSINTALRACARAGDWQGAMSLYSRIDRMRLRRTPQTFTSLGQALIQGGEWQLALEKLHQVTANGLQHNEFTHAAILAAEGVGSWERALQYWHAIQGDKAGRHSRVLTRLLDALVQGGEDQRALRVFGDMISRPSAGVEIDAFLAALRACEAKGRWEAATKIQEEIHARYGGGRWKKLKELGASSVIIESLATSLATGGEWKKALEVLQRNPRPMNSKRYNISVACSTSSEDWESALALLWEWGQQSRQQQRRSLARHMQQTDTFSRKHVHAKEMPIIRLHVPDTVPEELRASKTPVRFDGQQFVQAPRGRLLRSAARRTEQMRKKMMTGDDGDDDSNSSSLDY